MRNRSSAGWIWRVSLALVGGAWAASCGGASDSDLPNGSAGSLNTQAGTDGGGGLSSGGQSQGAGMVPGGGAEAPHAGSGGSAVPVGGVGPDSGGADGQGGEGFGEVGPPWDGMLPESGVCSVDGVCWERPLPFGNPLYDVWAQDADDLWAVGEPGALLHWDGDAWRGITGVQRNPLLRFVAVHGSSSTDVWAIGDDDPDNADDSTIVYHYAGSSWQALDYPAGAEAVAIWAHSPTDVWTVGAGGTVRRFQGTSWNTVATGSAKQLFAIHGFADDDLWVVGDAVALHWNGALWEDRSAGLPVGTALRAVWGAEPGDVWAVGDGAHRYDAQEGEWVQAVAGGYVDVTGSAPDEVYVLGDSDTENQLWSGSGFMAAESATNCAQPRAAVMFGVEDLVQVQSQNVPGDDVCLLTRGPVTAQARVHTSASFPLANQFPHGVHAAGEQLYLVEDGGLQRWTGETFESVSTPLSNINRFSSRDDDDIWLSTSDGWTAHSSGGDFTPVKVSEAQVSSVAFGTDDERWVASGKQLFSWDGQAWTAEHTLPLDVSAVASFEGKLYANVGNELRQYVDGEWVWLQGVGAFETELHVDQYGLVWWASQAWDGERWRYTIRSRYDVNGELWRVTRYYARRFDGTSWRHYELGADAGNLVSVGSTGIAWFGGGGKLLSYRP